MKIKAIAVTSALTLFSITVSLFAAPLTEQNKLFLSAYDKVHRALVADDLTGAKKAGSNLGAFGEEVVASKSLDEARTAFSKLSTEAEKLTAGQPGYYVMHCPMKKTDWVQTNDKVENPYGGKEMLTCGDLKK